ncbi:hypothetical protein N7532_007807 [Penicillium argentinense]|uniref:Nuclear pore complex component n=1 Tax=Penicillium argentinense TaxID=1131581 RepID=A0A9W9EW77_9EURO|nr:uncharacterized protein N7532_007807 [Penicillium argentinense]KAJ5089123.1 hypothetical protein N7532_007807 [Penicillium argentinense]
MASRSLPSTPKAAAPVSIPASAGSDTPGKWRHPQLGEVVRRQNASTFDDKNLRRLVSNAGALVVTWVYGSTFKSYMRHVFDPENHPVYHHLPLLLVQLFFAFNIFIALYPLFRRKDDFSDIPLTPNQRALLGLDPNATPPATPGTTYVTPPRYRVSTSRKASPASANGHSPSSPLSATPGLSGRRVSSGPFSPASSPLFHKAVSNENVARGSVRRQSIGSSSPLARSNSFSNSLGNSGNSFGNSFGNSLGASWAPPLENRAWARAALLLLPASDRAWGLATNGFMSAAGGYLPATVLFDF